MKRGRPRSCTCGECFKCKRADYMREWWGRKTIEEKREAIARRDPERIRLAAKRSYERSERHRRAEERRAANTPELRALKRKARVAVGNAVRDGYLTKGECAQAGEDCSGRVEAHHEDYTLPLDVTWYCRHHHETRHVELRQAA